jgi:hypothetical protein
MRKPRKEISIYEEICGSKKVSFRRTKQRSDCHVTGHVNWTASEVTCRNAE